MANEHKERCSVSLVIKDMQIKTKNRCKYTPTTLPKVQVCQGLTGLNPFLSQAITWF